MAVGAGHGPEFPSHRFDHGRILRNESLPKLLLTRRNLRPKFPAAVYWPPPVMPSPTELLILFYFNGHTCIIPVLGRTTLDSSIECRLP
jgi:hypothetical protein